MINNPLRDHLKYLLFNARKHDLPMPDHGYDNPKDIDAHTDQEIENLAKWLVQKYWDEHT